jgi:hypothetical protein
MQPSKRDAGLNRKNVSPTIVCLTGWLLLTVFSSCHIWEDATSLPASETPVNFAPLTFTATNTPTLILIPSPTYTPFPEPEGCLRPPDDMSMLEINGEKLNQRTYAMLQHAAELYGGVIDITGKAITQGSYTNSVDLSFGTHAGGGAVDLSVIDTSTGNWVVLEDEIEPLIYALRVAGFAAWYRDYGELAPDSPIHIHAIAIGDPDLSPSAIDQLTGDFGYFRGYDGIPRENGIPVQDKYGGPILCQWMWEMGYSDLRVYP